MRAKPKKLSQEPSLPWWVEILFVQVGLPDYLLRVVLKIKKKASKTLRTNKRPLLFSFLFVFSIIYFNPIVKKARLSNTCVQKTESYITNTLKGEKADKNAEVSIVAHNFCNGGTLNDY